MGQQRGSLDDRLIEFIEDQKIFFVATAAGDGKVNLSPKGYDTLKVLDNNKIIWLNLTGSGNETAAHILQNNRITLMFCAFSGPPLILRLYGTATIHHQESEAWKKFIPHFSTLPGARQIFEIHIDMVQTSCGMGVPFYQYDGQRDQLQVWANNKGEEGIQIYWQEKNVRSIDNQPTDIQKSISNSTSE